MYLCACWITSPSFDILCDEVLEVYFHHLMMWCLRSDIASYAEEDVYKPRQGVDGVKGLGPQRFNLVRLMEIGGPVVLPRSLQVARVSCTSPRMETMSRWPVESRGSLIKVGQEGWCIYYCIYRQVSKSQEVFSHRQIMTDLFLSWHETCGTCKSSKFKVVVWWYGLQ